MSPRPGLLQRVTRLLRPIGAALLCLGTAFVPAQAQTTIVQVCPGAGIQQRGSTFEPGGIILTAFDRESMWVYDIDGNRRYPLPDTTPCGTNCHLSPDARWITYMNALDNTYGKMRLDGTQRTLLVNYASDVEWWSADTLLVWTPARTAYLQVEGSNDRERLNVQGVISVQPGGRWGVKIEQDGDSFIRALIDLETRDLAGIAGGFMNLGVDVPYFNAYDWSPSGEWLAYAAPSVFDPQANISGAEILAARPADGQIVTWTDLNSAYGAVRINGRTASDLSWSPDSTRIAFWVIELLGPNPDSNTGSAVIHILNTTTGELRAYCDFTTSEHTPNPPRLIWSPDGTHLAFGGNVPGDDRGYLLVALNTDTGVFTELSEGIYPTLGGPNPVAWGLAP